MSRGQNRGSRSTKDNSRGLMIRGRGSRGSNRKTRGSRGRGGNKQTQGERSNISQYNGNPRGRKNTKNDLSLRGKNSSLRSRYLQKGVDIEEENPNQLISIGKQKLRERIQKKHKRLAEKESVKDRRIREAVKEEFEYNDVKENYDDDYEANNDYNSHEGNNFSYGFKDYEDYGDYNNSKNLEDNLSERPSINKAQMKDTFDELQDFEDIEKKIQQETIHLEEELAIKKFSSTGNYEDTNHHNSSNINQSEMIEENFEDFEEGSFQDSKLMDFNEPNNNQNEENASTFKYQKIEELDKTQRLNKFDKTGEDNIGSDYRNSYEPINSSNNGL